MKIIYRINCENMSMTKIICMTVEQQEKIFEPFCCAGGVAVRAKAGTYNCQKKYSNGKMEMFWWSLNPENARFCILFPRSNREPDNFY